MRSNSIIILTAITVLTLILGACTGQAGPGGFGNEGLPFIGGTEGLSMDFAVGAPPEVIFDAGQFPFTITTVIENVGEEDVAAQDAVLRVVGIDPGQFGLPGDNLEEPLPDPLRGSAKLVDGTQVPGDIATISIPNDGTFMSYLPDLSGNDQIFIRAELCYKYRTKSTTQICIKDQVLDNLYNDKVCSITGDKFPRNSGGPLQVTSVREFPQGQNNVQVTFRLEHVGTGLFFRPNGELECDDSISNPHENFVFVRVYFPGGDANSISCPLFGAGGNQGFVNLFQGRPRDISCVIKGDPDRDRIYQDILSIDIEYEYLTFIEKQILIQDVTTNLN